ncbi:MAG: bifunctional phosphopantothenoylcysteine decarboxylase/phosphopantothenate--cysteine ligase CoaBC [Chloroflexota bacterium]
MILEGKRVVLGITGGIAAYKAADLASKLVQAGAIVDVIMTEAATRFVTPLTLQTLTHRPVSLDMFRLLEETDMTHIALSERADVIIVAPVTANTIAKLAHGLADNLLTATILATRAPVLLAPAMNADMYANPATQANLRTLKERGFFIDGPAHGRLASGRVGWGRLVAVGQIIEAARQTLGREGPLVGVRVLVTAGGTQEPLDPVRHLGNRSSGRMGYALVAAARDSGADVRLVSAPTALSEPYGVEMVRVRTAEEMHREVKVAIPQTDILFMAAAVADYRPAWRATSKLKKGEAELKLSLTRTPDILESVAMERGTLGKPGLVVGFAAETDDLIKNAQEKLARKRLDLIVANDVTAPDSGFEVETNRVVLIKPDGAIDRWPLLDKAEVAERILKLVAEMWEEKHDEGNA